MDSQDPKVDMSEQCHYHEVPSGKRCTNPARSRFCQAHGRQTQLPAPMPCRGCGRPIVWATTKANRKAMPLDPYPTPDGNVDLEPFQGKWYADVLAGLFLEQARAEGVALYMPHHATCPKAAAFKGSR